MKRFHERSLILALLILSLVACAQPEARSSRPEAAIRHLLARQAAAWNRGDLAAFMAGYWHSPQLVFTSGGHIRRGWKTTIEAYRKHYGHDRGSMGRLAFSNLEIHRLGPRAAWVLGHWELKRTTGTSGGVFTLILRRFDTGWRIVHDHTSLAPPSSAAPSSESH